MSSEEDSTVHMFKFSGHNIDPDETKPGGRQVRVFEESTHPDIRLTITYTRDSYKIVNLKRGERSVEHFVLYIFEVQFFVRS